MSSCNGGEGSDDPGKAMRDMMGPGAVDQMVRHAVSQCWMLMPAARKTPQAVADEVRRIVERALRDLLEDAAAFDMAAGNAPPAAAAAPADAGE
jgi:hypothetical protein